MASIQRIQVDAPGPPEVMRLVEAPLPSPGPGEVLVQCTAIGVNFIDTYHRCGLYPAPLPTGIGKELAGVVQTVGSGVTRFAPGDRVATCQAPLGAYATACVVPAEQLIQIPAGVSDEQAAALMLKGLTVQYLIRQLYPVTRGETVLFHAAAGGVGLLAGQWLRHVGARAIGTAGSGAKRELALANGYDEVLDARGDDLAARLRDLTAGQGVPVVYDGVGAATFEASLDSLARRGLLVSFGNASGPVTGVDLAELARRGSLSITRPTLFDFIDTRESFESACADLFHVVGAGYVQAHIGQRFPLAQATEAHRALEARATTGCTLLQP